MSREDRLAEARNGYRVDPEEDDRPTLTFDEEIGGGYYAQVPNAFLRLSRYSTDAKLLYCLLVGYAGERASAFPGQETLAEHMNVSRPTVIKAMKELEDAGIVKTTRRGQGKTNLYHVHHLAKSAIERLRMKHFDNPVVKPHYIQKSNGFTSRSNVALHKEETGEVHTDKNTSSVSHSDKSSLTETLFPENVGLPARAKHTLSTDAPPQNLPPVCVAPLPPTAAERRKAPATRADQLVDFAHCFDKYLWIPHPHKKGLPAALKAAAKLTPAKFKEAIAKIPPFFAQWQMKVDNGEAAYIPHLSTWLNDETRWNEAIPQKKATPTSPVKPVGKTSVFDKEQDRQEQERIAAENFARLAAPRKEQAAPILPPGTSKIDALALSEFELWQLATNPHDAPDHIKAEWQKRES